MKILLIHTFYRHKGGEDTVFYEEQQLLSTSETVVTLTFQNRRGVIGAVQFFLSCWNIFASARIKNSIKQHRPDVIHIHNLHYAVGPIAIRTAHKHGIPICLTLHNYRLLCPSTILLFKGQIFSDSLGKPFPWRAIGKSVYRNSYLQTFWLAFNIWFHKKIRTWEMVDRYITLTPFAKDLFVGSTLGIPAIKFGVKPNFVNQHEEANIEREPHFLFVGRLSEEKGIKVLLESFCQTEFKLHIAGDGPLQDMVLDFCRQNKNIHYLGPLTKNLVYQEIRKCTALVLPSICYEGMPITIIEAFSCGTPVISSDIGAMKSMILNGYNGLHFQVGNKDNLRNLLLTWNNLDLVRKNEFYKNASSTYQQHYTPEANRRQLMRIYHDAIQAHENS